MTTNMGKTDRVVRLLLALVFTTLYFTNVIPGTLGIVLIAASVIFLFTSAVSFCPAYTLLGINTCSTRGNKA